MSGNHALLDTNILIGLLKGHPPAIAQLESMVGNVTFAYSAVTRMELLGFPGITDEEIAEIDAVLEDLQYLPINQSIEDRAIALRRSHRIKLPDAIIAATALVTACKLLTLDQELARIFQVEATS